MGYRARNSHIQLRAERPHKGMLVKENRDSGARGSSLDRASQEQSGSRLTGSWLWIGRVAWVALLALFVIPFLLGLPAFHTNILHPTKDSALLSPGAIRALISAGISLDTYGWDSLAVVCCLAAVSLIFSIVLFWRRSDDWMALLVSLFIAIYPIAIGDSQTIFAAPTAATALPSANAALMIAQSEIFDALLCGIVVLFPTGRFVPRWSWAPSIATCVWGLGIVTVPGLFGGLLFIGYPVLVLAAVACMVYRYRRVSTPLERTQTKWIIAGFAATLIGNQAFWLPSAFSPLGQTIYPPLFYLVYLLSFTLIPITFFIAVQRYRLYDIDRIINRALVYGALTAMLVGLYAACVIGAQALIRVISPNADQQAPIVTVASTLLIAALFRPLRTRTQRFIDSRFYRQKYDAARLLARFVATLRSEVDLPSLSEHLVATVDEAMQPAHISLLLLPTASAPYAEGMGARNASVGAMPTLESSVEARWSILRADGI